MNIFKHLCKRIAIASVFVFAGYLYGLKYGFVAEGLIAGLFFGIVSIIIESRLRTVSFGSILGGLLGLSIGLIFANLILLPLRYVITYEIRMLSSFVLNAILGYGGLFVGLHRGKNLTIPAIMRLFKGQELEEDLKILDTSVIIDGRIADVIETGFVEGTFIIPQFILQELQYIADSPDPMRRTKGRRGLDVLHRIQKMSNIEVRIVEEDFPKIKEVDAKLIALARLMNAKVITNDVNLNKVAQLQGVSVLNINELSNVLKPVVLPGEALNLFIVKEGKEYNQGVAYLDDGTMVVIENARRLIGKNVEVVVTSVLQTTAGRMIFAKLKEEE
ncbi:PIN/TRAM domain-containing protein [Dissulfurispira sp.]|uniref:PIN/TRAM domain-containing protein n=1 Tax=Dissulfurispira sp. TaxID=2817609 RepID=UPI002FDA2A2E